MEIMILFWGTLLEVLYMQLVGGREFVISLAAYRRGERYMARGMSALMSLDYHPRCFRIIT